MLITGQAALAQFESDDDDESYICMEDEFGMYDDGGVISGGSAFGGNYDEISESDFD